VKKVEEYNEESIVVLKGLQAVRTKPAMYIGNLDTGRFHILKEALDNGIDEALAGFSKKLYCNISADGYFTVADEGRGIPVGIHPDYKEEKKSTLEVIMTQLHAGGKIKEGAYAGGSVGTHGVGISCTNALSSYLQVWTYRDKTWWTQTYKCGVPQGPVEKGKPELSWKQGTIIKFKPDETILPEQLDPKVLANWFRNSSFLNPGIELTLNYKGKEKTYNSKGLADYIQWKTKDLNCEPLYKPFIIKTENCDVALQWFETEDSDLASWCNTSPTIEGGTHYKGLLNVINKGFDNLVKKKSYKPEDLRTGLYGAINFRIASPQFDSQTKEKLINPEAEKLVMDQIQKDFDKYLNSNKTFVKKIIDRANEIRSIYEKFAKEKKALSKLKSRGKVNLPPASKFISCSTKDVELRELFCTEGDSAAGTARQARDSKFQEIVKLRGKIMNVAKSGLLKAYESEDILNVLKAIGFDPSSKEHQLRVGKIVILTDADDDGMHISVLLLTLFQKIYPEIIEQGRVYIVDAPLFIGRSRTTEFYGESLEDVQQQANSKGQKILSVTRAKGWGEINPDLLRRFAFDPKTRQLKQITKVDTKGLSYFYKMVGDDTEVRKQILTEI